MTDSDTAMAADADPAGADGAIYAAGDGHGICASVAPRQTRGAAPMATGPYDPRQFLLDVAGMASLCASGIIDPATLHWAELERRALACAAALAADARHGSPRSASTQQAARPLPAPPDGRTDGPGHASDVAALKAWMQASGFATFTQAAAWLNERLGTRYTASEVGVWAHGKRGIPARVRPFVWPAASPAADNIRDTTP